MKPFGVLLLLAAFVSLAFAAKAPDIPTRSKIFLENKGNSDEAQLFGELLREKLSRDESNEHRLKPGFPVVDKREEADYILRFIFIMRSGKEYPLANVWLFDSKGNLLWENNYTCVRVFREPARECYQHISDDLKGAHVNAEGKRAGIVGWRRH